MAETTRRAELLERLIRIQQSISHRAPLQEVLDTITQGATDLIGDEIAGIRLIDQDDPEYLNLVSVVGVSPEELEALRHTAVGEGAGGRAISENQLVIMHDYSEEATAIPLFAVKRLAAAMAAPVRQQGRVVGSLVVATYSAGRRYSEEEQEALLALADHASVALMDANTVEQMREAQRSRDMFSAMVAHELKTPLTVILGTLRTVREHIDTISADDLDRMLASAYHRGLELERIIDRLLQSSRAELAGVKQHVFLPELLSDATSGFDRVVVVGAPKVIVFTDPVAVQKAIGILVENAVSHSPADSPIEVRASAAETEAVIEVTNRGSLPEGLDTSSLFAPFRRGPDVDSPGVGLGLYIADRLAASIGGSLGATSVAGRVTFTLRFPRA